MLTIESSLERLLQTAILGPEVELPLNDSLGLILAEDVAAEDDSPPFDKALMDGYAVRAADLTSDIVTFTVVELVTAGMVPTRTVSFGLASQIMTGAPIPTGADLVVKVEETERQGDQVRIFSRSTSPGTNIIRRGTSIRTGDVVVRRSTILNGSRVGALAELGRCRVKVHRRPTVAVLATGDELVPHSEKPGPGQIRNSNEAMLVAQISGTGAIPVPLGIARDQRDDLRSKILQGLQHDMLVLSGGVSAGLLDLVPSELANAGVREVFHKVELKPGKPIWFGVRDAKDKPRCLVFGLPGNPVSSLVCCELYVRTAIRKFLGHTAPLPKAVSARLTHDHQAKADRPTYHPAELIRDADGLSVRLVPWHGSSDLCGTAQANGMAFLTGDERLYRTGERLNCYEW